MRGCSSCSIFNGRVLIFMKMQFGMRLLRLLPLGRLDPARGHIVCWANCWGTSFWWLQGLENSPNRRRLRWLPNLLKFVHTPLLKITSIMQKVCSSEFRHCFVVCTVGHGWEKLQSRVQRKLTSSSWTAMKIRRGRIPLGNDKCVEGELKKGKKQVFLWKRDMIDSWV